MEISKNLGGVSIFIVLTLLFQNFVGSQLANTEPVISTDVFKNSLTSLLNSDRVKSLTDPKYREAETPPPIFDHCPTSSEVVGKAFYHNTEKMKYVAESFYNGVKTFQSNPTENDLVKKLILQLENIALATIAASIEVNSKQIGWNGLTSDWDAWSNGSCTSLKTPNLYHSANALLNLTLAYEITKDSVLKAKFYDAFIKGTDYWLDFGASTNLNDSYMVSGKDKKAILDYYSTKSAYRIFKNFILGGQRTDSVVSTDKQYLDSKQILPRPFRFFYTVDDPALVSLNCSGLLGYVFLKMGVTLRNEKKVVPTYNIPTTTIGFAKKDLYYIGYWTVFPIYFNFLNKNASYNDIDSFLYSGNAYEKHLATLTLPLLVRSASILDAVLKPIYLESALSMGLTYSYEIDDPLNISGKRLGRCSLRNLDEHSNEICRSEVDSSSKALNAITDEILLSAATDIQ